RRPWAGGGGGGAPAGDTRAADCGGNPLLLGWAATSRGGRGADPEPLLARFVDGQGAVRQVAEAAAVLGLEHRLSVAADIAGLEGAQRDAALEMLFERDVLVQAGPMTGPLAQP